MSMVDRIKRQYRHCTYSATMRRVLATIVVVEKQLVLQSMYVCICSLRYPACNAHAPYCHVACPALHFSTLSHKRQDFRKRVTEHKMCVSRFSTNFVWNIFHSKKKWERYDKKMYIGPHVKCPLFLSDFNETWNFSKYCRKILKYQISWKSVQWEPSCSMRTDGQTWRS